MIFPEYEEIEVVNGNQVKKRIESTLALYGDCGALSYLHLDEEKNEECSTRLIDDAMIMAESTLHRLGMPIKDQNLNLFGDHDRGYAFASLLCG